MLELSIASDRFTFANQYPNKHPNKIKIAVAVVNLSAEISSCFENARNTNFKYSNMVVIKTGTPTTNNTGIPNTNRATFFKMLVVFNIISFGFIQSL
jgi:hypothetical protein